MVRQWVRRNLASGVMGAIAVAGSLFVVSCSSEMGFQGGIIPEQFTGIDSAIAISPQSIQLSWSAYPGSTRYKVYISDKNEAIYEPGFTSVIFQPSPIDPARTYQYSVTAVDPNTGQEIGNRTRYIGVNLLPHFNFNNTGSAVPSGKTSIRVNWQGAPLVTYKVYLAERLPTGLVNYNNFIAATQNVVGASTVNITGLQEGKEYCAIVVAAYSDQTNDAPDGTLFTTELSATLSSPAWMLGPSGTFGDSKISQVQKCARTQSDFSITNMRVYAPKASLASRPTFYVDIPGDTVEDTNGTVETSIYRVEPSTGLATFIGKRTGTGRITATASVPSGRYKFFAILRDLQGAAGAQDRKEIIVGPNGTTPNTANDRPWVYIRSFNETENPTQPAGYYPEKQQAGFGSQKSGSAVAMGDFNCDGRSDLAIGVPDSTVMASDNRPAKQGKVIVYYNVSNGTPSTTSRIQEIRFDITQHAGDPGRDLRLGTKLLVGNFNRDNQITNQYGSIGGGQNSAFNCDDIAIGSGYGPMFVLYGRRDVSGFDGGLNYTNTTSYAYDPSSSCDESTNICEPAMFGGGSTTRLIGKAFTLGDFNGDGYLDLAASTGVAGGTPGVFTDRGIMVFRGSEYGLIPPESFSDAQETVSFPSGPRPSFPYMPYAPNSFSPRPTPVPGWGDASFGSSLATLQNSYYDANPANLAQGTKRVRDILLVGVPSYNGAGRVIACSPQTDFTLVPIPTFSSEPNTSLFWYCNRFIDPPQRIAPSGTTILGDRFGAAMVGISNPLRYQPDQFKDGTCATGDPNCSGTSMKMGFPGAVAIGDSNAGRVFVYYVPANPGAFANRDTMGNARNTIVTNLFQQVRHNGSSAINDSCSYNTAANSTLCVETSNPCRTAYFNTGAALPAGVEYCNIQQLTHPTSSGGNFGSILAALPGNNVPDPQQAKDSILAVAAPNRSLTVSGGITYNEVGSVQLYMQQSNFVSNPIVVKPGTTTCAVDGYCRFSTGFSNSLTTSIDYDGELGDQIYFGAGGIASGPIESDPLGTQYSNNNDIVVGAPGHVARVSVSGNTIKVYDNGAAMVYFSHGGTYRSYRTAEAGPIASPWHLIDRSFSQESEIKFHIATSIGDINADGQSDIAVRINSGTRNKIRLYFGKSDQLGFQKNLNQVQHVEVPGDLSAGVRFIPLGKITNGQFPSFLITSQSASYIYFAGISGLIQGAPSAFGIGGTPRKLYRFANRYLDAAFGDYINYLRFDDSVYPNNEVNGNLDSTLRPNASFASGDFNGDGFGDVAMTMSIENIADISKTNGCAGNLCFGANFPTTQRRVMIFYGGADNGFQIQPNSAGFYPASSDYVVDYSSDNTGTPSLFGAPCSVTGTNCKIQMLTEGTAADPLINYGESIASVPVGDCVVNGNNVPVNALVVQGRNSATPGPQRTRLYVYKPKCLGTSGDLSGLVAYTNEKRLTLPAAAENSATTGYGMSAVSNLMGSGSTVLSHLVFSDRDGRTVYSIPVQAIDAFGKNFGTVADTAIGGRTINYSSSNMMVGLTGAAAGFGMGITDVGDINGDGFGDVAIGMSSLTRQDISTQTLSQGAVLVLFGSPNGLQSHSGTTFTSVIDPARDAFCYTRPDGSIISSVCNPTLVFLPQPTNSIRNGAYERLYLGRHSKLSFGNQNENLGSFLLGVPGRDSLESLSSDRILNGGAFYVLP